MLPAAAADAGEFGISIFQIFWGYYIYLLFTSFFIWKNYELNKYFHPSKMWGKFQVSLKLKERRLRNHVEEITSLTNDSGKYSK